MYDVSRETLKKFNKYKELLIIYRSKFNLIAKGDIDNLWLRHFGDSAKIFFIVRPHLKSKMMKSDICDIGSGAGFPGAVLAIFMEEYGFNNKITLIESNAKKCAFLKELRQKLN